MTIPVLGEPGFASPVRRTVPDGQFIPERIVCGPATQSAAGEVLFELAGPRPRLFFDPARTRAGIVTCGGLCPGLNDVIRSLFLELHYEYGVSEVLGFRGGYQGLDPSLGPGPILLTPAAVDSIHQQGGTILGTSRGPVDIRRAVDHLIARHVVHAAMAGKTGLVIGHLHDEFIHVPIELLTGRTKRLDPDGPDWRAVIAATGQPERFA